MSRPQVTITLGRSGQVVKRAETSSSDYVPSSGSKKRSIKDRLGYNADNQQSSKRQKRDGSKRTLGGDDLDGALIGKNDLRYKLMRKKMSRKAWSDGEGKGNNVDLREKLSRAAQPPTRSDTRHKIPKSRLTITRQRVPDSRAIDARQRMPESREIDTRQQMPERTNGLLRRIPHTRSVDDLDQMEPLRNSYSGWTLDGLRRRSPDRLLGTSRGLSPPRTMDVRRPVGQISSATHVDASRPTPFIGKDVYNASRPTSYMPKTSIPLEPGNSVGRLPPSAPAVGQKVSYLGEEATVPSLLHSLGLGKYAILFQAEEVDMTVLKQMGESDLKELGIPMGPRKKILLAATGRSKRQP